MSDRPYIRAPKEKLKGSKFDLCDEDKEDFEQESLIREWLEREGCAGEFEFKHISRKGTARNTLDTRSVRLDQKMFDDPDSGTNAEIIAGSDGRDLECGLDAEPPPPSFDETVESELLALGIKENQISWVKKTLEMSRQLSRTRRQWLMNDGLQFNTYPTNSGYRKRSRNSKK